MRRARRRLRPRDEARVFLAPVLLDDGGSVEGRRKAALAAITASPDSVDALTGHAIEEVRAGNADGALQSLARAEMLEPWNPTADAGQQALDVLPDDPPAAR